MAGWLVSEREVKFYKFSRIEAIFFFFRFRFRFEGKEGENVIQRR